MSNCVKNINYNCKPVLRHFGASFDISDELSVYFVYYYLKYRKCIFDKTSCVLKIMFAL